MEEGGGGTQAQCLTWRQRLRRHCPDCISMSISTTPHPGLSKQSQIRPSTEHGGCASQDIFSGKQGYGAQPCLDHSAQPQSPPHPPGVYHILPT